MIHLKRTRICILLIIAILMMCLPTAQTVHAASTDRYGYTLLKNENQRKAYSALAAGIGNAESEISFTINGITNENVNAVVLDVKTACEMMTKDYPEYFWYSGGGQIRIQGSTVTYAPAGYVVNQKTVTAASKELKDAKAAFNAAINKALAKLPANPSDYEIAHTFHDYIISNVSYEMKGDHQTAYGALVGGKAVCAGYARAYQVLMNKAGIRCTYVTGKSYAPSGELVDHAWNLAWLDGMCYYTDVTWDDQDDDLFHEYLNMSKQEISKTHFTTDTLPVSCGHNAYTFFKMNKDSGVCDIQDHKDVSEVAKCFALKSKDGNEVVYYCTIHYHKNDFEQWLSTNIGTIAKTLGFLGAYSYKLIELGMEHHVVLSGTVSGSAVVPTAPPTEPTPTTRPTTPKPTEPQKPTDKPTEPVGSDPTVRPTEPSGATEPTGDETEPSTGYVPTDPSNGTQPATDPSQQTQPTTGSDTPTQPGATQAPTTPDQGPDATAAPSSPSTDASKPADGSKPNAGQPNGSDGNNFMFIALGVGGVAVIAAALSILFGFRKKKD